ncbi:MAG TPA: HPF/RaiA family ribosome-associated protein [Kofleriaceae bacterium]|nr:HPF/RaiA family ribosome-associated protein [Kofleriaceae bacterium]
MQTPTNITFRSMDASPAVEQAVADWCDRLEHTYGRIGHCSVVIELPHRRHRHGKTFHVRIELALADRTIAVSRDPGHDHAHEDVYVALGDAFRAARRQLQDYARIRRGDVKLHA